MIYYNLLKNALEEIWYEYKRDIKLQNGIGNTLWDFFKNIIFSLSCIIGFLFFIPIDILLSPIEIAAIIYYYFIEKYN